MNAPYLQTIVQISIVGGFFLGVGVVLFMAVVAGLYRLISAVVRLLFYLVVPRR